jgi:hypothetical protein
VRCNVRKPEIARQKRIDEQSRRNGQQKPDRIDRALAADSEEGVLLKPAENRRNNCVHGKAEGEQNAESADIFHCELFSVLGTERDQNDQNQLWAWFMAGLASVFIWGDFIWGLASYLDAHFACTLLA